MATIIVPARLASSRFPEKVLAAATGKPLVQHVVEAARRASCAGLVVVAADSPRIAAALSPFGTRVVLTREDHPNGTSRLAEAAGLLGLVGDDIVVNAQGDEPEMAGETIDAAVQALVSTTGADVGTVAAPIADESEAGNPNVVKVVRACDGRALYFSRSLIPFDRDGRRDPAARPLRHVGVYAYRKAFLDRYVAMASTPLERSEQLEQLRVLEHGGVIGVGLCESAHAGIDTPEQYDAFVARWSGRSDRTPMVRLRPVAPGDLPAMFELQSDPRANEMAGTKARTREAFFAAWEKNFANPRINARVIELVGERGAELAGSIACFQAAGEERDSVGYWVARAHWGKGVASRALAAFLLEERRRPLHATTAKDNAPSRRILEKCGFRCVGFSMGQETDRFLAREIAEFVLE